MMNDYADEKGWEERVTPKEIGRIIDIRDSNFIKSILEVVTTALYIKTEENNTDIESKN